MTVAHAHPQAFACLSVLARLPPVLRWGADFFHLARKRCDDLRPPCRARLRLHTPGLEPRANLNVGLGQIFAALRKDLVGDEVTLIVGEWSCWTLLPLAVKASRCMLLLLRRQMTADQICCLDLHRESLAISSLSIACHRSSPFWFGQAVESPSQPRTGAMRERTKRSKSITKTRE